MPGGSARKHVETFAGGETWQWNGVCANCVAQIDALNEVYGRERAERAHQRQREEREQAERQQRLALRTMQDIDASNRPNSRSYVEACNAMRAEENDAMAAWGVGSGFADTRRR